MSSKRWVFWSITLLRMIFRAVWILLLAGSTNGAFLRPLDGRRASYAPLSRKIVSPGRNTLFVAMNEADIRSGINSDSSSSSNAQQSQEGSVWWKDVELEHAFVAAKTRPDFALLCDRSVGADKALVYLDSAATSQKPDSVLKKLNQYYTRMNSNVHRGAHTLSREATEAYEMSRDKVASFIHATSRNEIVFTSGATEAINLVAQSYGRTFLKEGDEIVLTVAEHHSNLVPWQLLATEKGVVLKFVKLSTDGALDLTHMQSLLSGKTKLVSFQHVSNVLACINPVAEIVSMVRAAAPPDCKILLDACQSVPHMPVSVADLGVDFLVASGHKMCGPTGIGFLWGRESTLNEMPPWKGGGEMIDQVTLEGSTWQPAPARFEAGTPAIAQAIGLGAAIDYLNNVGMEQINAYEHDLAEYLYRRLSSVPGITIVGPTDPAARAALCAFSHSTVHPSDLSSFLDLEGIAVRSGHHCCQPLHQALGISHSSRASLYFYNTKEYVLDLPRRGPLLLKLGSPLLVDVN
jgi:cysteine desulfurase / selenocysteine lyase